ncbi:Uncharacterized protein dnm_016740 [Desulfonema magnum]|uniref:Uncharacterized protein n=1 Tax=Desulfonema magnum TaxID=45655 RepID=A0A975GLB5_9BACT|nr:Uncharacterized protein dnm_016740 [Desulfonema magnum]
MINSPPLVRIDKPNWRICFFASSEKVVMNPVQFSGYQDTESLSSLLVRDYRFL